MMPVHHRARSTPAVKHLARTISACIAAAVLIGVPALSRTAQAGDVPTFAVDASWPKPLPNNWIIGQVGGITVDSKDHVWVIHRPRSLTDDEKGAALTPPRSKCCVSAPPVLEFDADGNLLRSWGGPGEGYEWVGREHGIEVDDKGIVWLAGNADNDNALMKFTSDGKFVMQIGKIAPTKGSNDTTQLGKPAEITFDKEANELYVADGYGNRRVIVFDADDRRLQAALGRLRQAAERRQAGGRTIPRRRSSQQFGNPVHCVKVANDGLVYVCDRINNRIQVFKKDGTFVTEWFYEKNTLGNGAVWDVAIWPDPNQTYLLSADGENNEIRVLNRADGTVVGQLRPQRPQCRPVPLDARHGRGFQGQRLYRRGRHRKARPEVQADLGRATIGGLPGMPSLYNVADEDAARRNIWSSDFDMSWDWRAQRQNR